MLAGKVPFDADSAVSVALMQLQKEPKKLTEINLNIPLGIEQICFHAMQKNPDDRYQTATEMLLDLEEVIRNPQATFDYTYFVDKEPTKYVFKEGVPQKTDEDSEDTKEDTVTDYDPNHKKKVITAVVVGVVLLIAAIIGIVVFMTQGVNTSTHQLENFVGQSYDDLASSEEYDYVFVAEYEKTDEYEPGIVISQMPEAGERVISGSTVTLYVAASNDDIEVPNLYEYTVEAAERVLNASNLTNYTVSEVSSETVDEGSVIYTEPKAGSVVSANTPIVLYVSSGPTTTQIASYTVPDVVGLSQTDAQEFLEKSGFTNVNVETQDSAVRRGVVLSQTPRSGTSAREDERITITVSTGTPPTTAPQQYTVTLNATLPSEVDSSGNHPHDTLVVTVNGTQYSSQTVTLDGSTVQVAIPVNAGETVQILVELTEISATHSLSFNMNENKESSFYLS